MFKSMRIVFFVIVTSFLMVGYANLALSNNTYTQTTESYATDDWGSECLDTVCIICTDSGGGGVNNSQLAVLIEVRDVAADLPDPGIFVTDLNGISIRNPRNAVTGDITMVPDQEVEDKANGVFPAPQGFRWFGFQSQAPVGIREIVREACGEREVFRFVPHPRIPIGYPSPAAMFVSNNGPNANVLVFNDDEIDRPAVDNSTYTQTTESYDTDDWGSDGSTCLDTVCIICTDSGGGTIHNSQVAVMIDIRDINPDLPDPQIVVTDQLGALIRNPRNAVSGNITMVPDQRVVNKANAALPAPEGFRWFGFQSQASTVAVPVDLADGEAAGGVGEVFRFVPHTRIARGYPEPTLMYVSNDGRDANFRLFNPAGVGRGGPTRSIGYTQTSGSYPTDDWADGTSVCADTVCIICNNSAGGTHITQAAAMISIRDIEDPDIPDPEIIYTNEAGQAIRNPRNTETGNITMVRSRAVAVKANAALPAPEGYRWIGFQSQALVDPGEVFRFVPHPRIARGTALPTAMFVSNNGPNAGFLVFHNDEVQSESSDNSTYTNTGETYPTKGWDDGETVCLPTVCIICTDSGGGTIHNSQVAVMIDIRDINPALPDPQIIITDLEGNLIRNPRNTASGNITMVPDQRVVGKANDAFPPPEGFRWFGFQSQAITIDRGGLLRERAQEPGDGRDAGDVCEDLEVSRFVPHTRIARGYPEPALMYVSNDGRDASFRLFNPAGDSRAAGGRQKPGDYNQDGDLDVSDAISVFGYLFLGAADPGCPAGLDYNGDDRMDLSDGIGLLSWLFQGGAGHALGLDCVVIENCENACN